MLMNGEIAFSISTFHLSTEYSYTLTSSSLTPPPPPSPSFESLKLSEGGRMISLAYLHTLGSTENEKLVVTGAHVVTILCVNSSRFIAAVITELGSFLEKCPSAPRGLGFEPRGRVIEGGREGGAHAACAAAPRPPPSPSCHQLLCVCPRKGENTRSRVLVLYNI